MKHPTYLGEQGTEQFTVETYVNGERIGERAIHDPFIHTTVVLRGWRHAWRALFGEIKVQVSVSGSQGAQRAIMTLDPEKLANDTKEFLEQCRISRETSPTMGYCVEG